MAVSLFTGNVIAVLWDFDQTLIPGYQQKPLFEEFGIDADAFWAEVGGLPDYYKAHDLVISGGTAYLNHILTYVREGKMAGLTNAKLRELGGRLEFYPGLPDFLVNTRNHIEERPDFKRHGIKVEHYVVSS